MESAIKYKQPEVDEKPFDLYRVLDALFSAIERIAERTINDKHDFRSISYELKNAGEEIHKLYLDKQKTATQEHLKNQKRTNEI